MNLQTKSLVYQFICFAVLFVLVRYLALPYTGLSGIWLPVTAFVICTLICPVFKAVRTPNGEKLFVKWLFLKGVKEIK
jgi:hypothetical protein